MRNHSVRRVVTVAVAAVAASLGVAGPVAASHDSAADQTIASAGTLTLADLPAGWTSQPGTDANRTFVEAAGSTKECKPYVAALKKAASGATAASPQLRGGTQGAHNDVIVFGGLSEASSILDLYASTATHRCLEKVVPTLVQTELSKDPALRANLGKVSLVTSDPVVPTEVGTGTRGYQFVIAVDGKDGSSRNYYYDDQMVQVGRAVSHDVFTNIDTPVDGVRDAAVASATSRLEGALGMSLVIGETATLRDALVPVKGYTYVEPDDEMIQSNSEFLNDPDIVEWGCLDGHTDHFVLKGGAEVGAVQLYGYRSTCTAEPGFREAELVADAADFSSDENGNQIGDVSIETIDGTSVAVVSVPDNPDYWATTYMWFDGDVEWMVNSDQAAPAPLAKAFVQKVIAAQRKAR